ncbi:ataxin-3 [Hydra vulgaris]|uniref:ubiquitinyl hydrolase 1 n=1 Tax=Hydra vulgaris TaxID=6087 RepID=A0ABM4BL71_HYDVU
MESIFHEKQEGSLCAQHCLNSLLQGPYFNAVDLASFAHELDEAERSTMAEGNIDSLEYKEFIKQPSFNMDDSGYFSIQVICKALSVWNLDVIPFNSNEAENARKNPVDETAYICNQQNHWLTIRKLGKQWFNLNSIKAWPELISDTYLSMLLAQLQTEGYSIFVIRGVFPECEAEQLFFLCGGVTKQDYELFDAKQRSLIKTHSKKNNKALEAEKCCNSFEEEVNPDLLRNKRVEYFEKQLHLTDATDKNFTFNSPDFKNELTDEEKLKAAIEMSLQPIE